MSLLPPRRPLLLLALAALLAVAVGRLALDDPTPRRVQPPPADDADDHGPRLRGADAPPPTLESWFAALREVDLEDEGVRATFVEALRERLRKDPGALDQLRAWTRWREGEPWPDELSMEDVFLALSLLGPEGGRILADLLEDPPDDYRERLALETLVALGPDAAPALVPVMAVASRPPSDWSRADAIRVLGAIGAQAAEAAPLLHGFLEPPVDDGVAGVAAEALVSILGGTPEVLASLRAAILDEDTRARAAVLTALATLGPEGRALQADVLPLLDDLEGPVRRMAAEALAAMGDDSETVVGALVALLVAEKNTGADRALAALGPAGEQALATLAREGAEPRDRLSGLRGLGRAGVDLHGYLDVLLDLLEADLAPGWRREALGMLAALDPPPRDPDVLRRLELELLGERVEFAALMALARQPGPEARALLLDWARGGEGGSRPLEVADAFLHVGVPGAPAADLVFDGLERASWSGDHARGLALLARLDPSPDPERVLDAATEALAADDAGLRTAALRALGSVEGHDDRVLPLLLHAVDDRATRWVAVQAVVARPGAAARSVPALIAAYARHAEQFWWHDWTLLRGLLALAPHWSGTADALEAAVAGASEDARPRLVWLREKVLDGA